MKRQENSPLGGLRRVAERRRAQSERRQRLGRVTEAFRRRDEAAETERRSWLGALSSQRAPFPWRSRVAQREAGRPKTASEAEEASWDSAAGRGMPTSERSIVTEAKPDPGESCGGAEQARNPTKAAEEAD